MDVSKKPDNSLFMFDTNWESMERKRREADALSICGNTLNIGKILEEVKRRSNMPPKGRWRQDNFISDQD